MSPTSAAPRDILRATGEVLTRAQQFNTEARARLADAVRFKNGAHERFRAMKAAVKEIRRRRGA